MQRTHWTRPTVVLAVASLGWVTSPGCDDEESDDGLAPAALGGGDTGDSPGDGEGDTGGPGAPGVWEFAPIYGVPNVDDDDQDGKRDWLQPPFDGDDEPGVLTIPAEALGPGNSVRLTLTGDLDGVRMWHEGEHILGSGLGAPITEYEFIPDGDDELTWEFGEFLNHGHLTLERLDGGGEVTTAVTIELVSSPLILNHHLQPAEHLWIVQTYDNQPFVEGYEAALGDDLTPVPGAPYLYDRWIQDELEFAYSQWPAANRLDTVIDSIRDRGLDDFPEDTFSEPNWHIDTWGNPFDATTFDGFGNLDASPPIEGYPFGRIYYGYSLESNWGLDSVLADFLAEQTLQAPFFVDTSWLCVGHVDEFSTFIPDASSPKGFKMLLSSTTAAYGILDGLDPGWGIGRYESAYGFATAGELAADDALRALNMDIQANELDPLRDKFEAELGLDDEDIIEIPTIFETLDFCAGYKVAMTPGTVNLVVANLDGEGIKLIVPDPFLRPANTGPEDDPLAQDFVRRMPEGIEVVFLDDWYSYHLLDGEVHCGTNLTRTPTEHWWAAGADLLGLQGGN